ncbi:MAG: sugar ABC transporter permease [Cyanobacteria bacterium CRU_2_1]|nr:sugar ABC transporter permease [Cyanobacteria bacterium RU_5_0]NJR57388.1 sugar ABC transporter permease [Cyanobacteria bacterium CRU_2_1]
MKVTISLNDPDLSDEALQRYVEALVPQVKEVDGVEDATLVPFNQALAVAGMTPKSVGGFLIGAMQAEVNFENIGKLWNFLKDRLANKSLEAAFEAPDGRKFTGKANNQEDFEFLMQQAEEFFKA